MRKFFVYMMMGAACLFAVCPLGAEAATVSEVSGISSVEEEASEIEIELEDTKLTLKKGDSRELEVNVTAGEIEGDDLEIDWSSTNKKVATVSDEGKVKAKRAGTCTIKARLSGTDAQTKCKVTVKTTKGNPLKYGAKFDKKVTTKSLKKKNVDEFTDNAGNTYTKGKKVGNFVLTGYCSKCNSGSSRGTSSGKTATAGITVAVNTAQIPLGKKLIIGDHVYVAQDRHGNRRHSKVIDVFFGTNHRAECYLKNIPVYYAK